MTINRWIWGVYFIFVVLKRVNFEGCFVFHSSMSRSWNWRGFCKCLSILKLSIKWLRLHQILWLSHTAHVCNRRQVSIHYFLRIIIFRRHLNSIGSKSWVLLLFELWVCMAYKVTSISILTTLISRLFIYTRPLIGLILIMRDGGIWIAIMLNTKIFHLLIHINKSFVLIFNTEWITIWIMFRSYCIITFYLF